MAEDPAALRWVWESLWSERQTGARGDKFELAVPETVLFREGRATRWYFTSNAGTLLKRHGFRLAWPQSADISPHAYSKRHSWVGSSISPLSPALSLDAYRLLPVLRSVLTA